MTDPQPGPQQDAQQAKRRKKSPIGDAAVAAQDVEPDGGTWVFGLPDGPTHLAQDSVGRRLSVCGVKSQFRHVDRPGTVDDVTCEKCLRLLAKSETRAWRA